MVVGEIDRFRAFSVQIPCQQAYVPIVLWFAVEHAHVYALSEVLIAVPEPLSVALFAKRCALSVPFGVGRHSGLAAV